MASGAGLVYGGGAESGFSPNAGIGTAGLRVGGAVEGAGGFMEPMFDLGPSADFMVGVLDGEPEFLRDLLLKKLRKPMVFGEGACAVRDD